jgi:hypothetical protein
MPQLEASNMKSNWYGVRTINIKNWQSSVANQYDISGVPLCMIYNPSGQLLESSSGACKFMVQTPELVNTLEK